MKKFTNTGLGGGPFHKDDMKEIFNDELWKVIQAMLSKYDSDTQGIIVSGCVFSDNAGNFDMTAGIVYLNGEFMEVAAVTNQSFTKYIAPATPVNDTRTFNDLSSQTFAVTKSAEIVGSAPGAGQYITIASLTGMDGRRLGNDSISFIIDGGGAVITTGEKGHLRVPFDCVITGCTMLADVSGSIVVDIWKDTYANFPPTNADSITASANPTISADVKSQDLTLTGWTTVLAKDDILAYNVDSISTIKRVTIILHVRAL